MTSKIKVDNINKVSDDSNIIKKCGTTITLGASGDSIALASGASQTGFGREGSVNWQTGSLKTATFTAVSGEGYFINQGSAITMNLPAGSAGAIVAVSDYARNFATHNLTISPNGSEKIGCIAASAILSTEGQSVTFVYVDGTEGWKNIQDSTSNVTGNAYIVATGGNAVVTCGSFKTHIFTGPGTFTVSNGGIFGSLLSTPILNAPQTAILGMHKIEDRPVVVDGEIVVRPMMYLAMSYDHRMLDGKEAVSFLVSIKEQLENPEKLLLNL